MNESSNPTEGVGMSGRLFALVGILGLLFAPVAAKADGPALTGVVGWYGTGREECLGCRGDRLMANGEHLRNDELTIACGKEGSCEVFPLGTWVEITNLRNGRTVEAQVTDTGGFETLARIGDCSKEVARQLDFLEQGLARVRIEVLSPDFPYLGAMP